MSGVTASMAKCAKLSLEILYSVCFFQLKLLSVCRRRNLFPSTSSVNLLPKTMFKLRHVLFLIENCVSFVLSKFSDNLLALTH